jgi:DNA-binding CsgD family transcriptional regulator
MAQWTLLRNEVGVAMLSTGLAPQKSDAEASPREAASPEGVGLNYVALAEQIAQRLGCLYPRLTDRERIVCGYTLAGYTAEGISLILGVGISTIVTYRRRAYSRLGVSNANQLIAPLLV